MRTRFRTLKHRQDNEGTTLKPLLKRKRIEQSVKSISELSNYQEHYFKGYFWFLFPSHPYAPKNNYIKRSRLVMECIHKRFLSRDEKVHHKNEIKTDDSPDNLEIYSNSEHAILHCTGRKCSPETRAKIGKANAISQKGKVISLETRNKFSLRRGDRHPMFGKHHTEESKLKISESKIGTVATESTREKLRNINKNRKRSEKGTFI